MNETGSVPCPPDGPRSSIRHFSLMNSLLAVLNSSPRDATDSVLARYFLKHFEHLDRLNVYNVANECFTSRSGIRRFCQSIGLDNFSDLKSYSWEWSRHRKQFISYGDHADYRSYLATSIEGMLDRVNRVVSDGFLDELARLIHAARHVTVLASDFSSMSIRQFQQSMLYLHKIVHIVTDSTGDISQLESMDSRDILIVISEHGNYARAVRSALSESDVTRALITVDADDELIASYDYAIRLSSEPPEAGRTVYAQYGITYTLDLLYNRYFTLFGS